MPEHLVDQPGDRPVDQPLDLADVAAWEAWLEGHHDTAPEVWLQIAKKGSGLPTIGIRDALEGALCFGWIDGQRQGLDDVSFRRAARADGRWDAAYERQSTATVPDDPAEALAADPVAAAAFEALSRTERYLVFLPVLKATTPQVRANQVARAVRRLGGRS